MADANTAGASAKATLRRVAEQLLTLANRGDAEEQSQAASNAEHQRVFNYMPPRAGVFNPKKKKSASSKKGKGKLQSCTLKFFCLSKVHSEKPPNSVFEKTALSNCGLGPGSITLDVNSTASDVHHNLLEKYPLLQVGGGYELLLYQRGGTEQGFHNIPAPYTPAKIKELAGQAQVYIRPLQKDLDDIQETEIPCSAVKESGPLVKCLLCTLEIPMHELKQHAEEVHGNMQKRSSSTTALDDFLERDTKKSKVEVTIPDDDDPPLAGPSFISDDELSQLQEMFPCRPQNCLRDSLLAHGTVNKAALSLAGLEDGEDDSDLYQSPFQEVPPSLQTIIDDLKKHLSDEKEKLKVEEDDILNDALTYYKDRDFDPKKKLRIVFKNQPAADTGGVVRQFFTELLREISEVFFYGDKSKRPIYNSDIVSSGMMKLVGVIIVHSILLAGLGFPVLSRSVYRYLATGKTDEVVQNMTIDDCSARIRCYIQKVTEAGDDFSSLDEEESTNILSECGLTFTLTKENQMRVIQAVMTHDIIGKPKIVLDQLREGLATLGFGEAMLQHPDLFEELFLHDLNVFDSESIITALKFPSVMNSDETTTHDHLVEFLQGGSQETLKRFLTFATGSPVLPEFGLGKIEIKFEDSAAVFASACMGSLTFPKKFPDKETFNSSMEAVISNAKGTKSFNCV